MQWSDFEQNDVEDKLAAFQRLTDAAGLEDIPQLLALLASERNGFWERELLAEPIGELGGAKYLPELLEAAEKNRIEGHDNDSFNHHLSEIAWADLKECERKLRETLANNDFRNQEKAEWLLTFYD